MLSRRRAFRVQQTVMLMEWQQKGVRHTMSTEVGRSSQSVIYRRSSKYMESGGLVQPIWRLCLNEIVRPVASTEIQEEGKKEGESC